MPDPTLPVFDTTPGSAPRVSEPGLTSEPVLPVPSTDETLKGGRFGAIQENRTANIPVDEYRDYMPTVRLGTDLDKIRAANQSTGEKWLNFGGQFLGEILGGTVSAFGSIPEIADTIYSEVTNGDADFNNWMMQFGEDIIQGSKTKMPIYEANPGKTWAVNDLGWWLNRGVSVASGLSMLIPGKAVTSGLGLFSKALAEAAKVMQVEGKLGKALRIGENLTRKQNELTKIFATAATMRNAENMRESLAVVQQTKQDLAKRFEDDQAYADAINSDIGAELIQEGRVPTKQAMIDFIAAKAGHRAYLINSANIIFDLAQASALIKTNYFTRTGASGRKIAQAIAGEGTQLSKSALLGATLKPYAAGIFNSLGESVEEGINYMGTEEANKLTRHNLGDRTVKVGILDNLQEYLTSPDMYEAAFFGAIGGAVFEGAAHGINALRSKEGVSDTSTKIAEIQQRYAALTAFNSKVKELTAKANTTGTNRELIDAQLLNAKHQLIYNLGMNAAATGNVDLLIDTIENGNFQDSMLKGMSEQDLKALQSHDRTADTADILKKVLSVERHYNDGINKLSNKPVAPATREAMIKDYTLHNYIVDMANDHVSRVTGIIQSYTSKDKTYNDLVAQGVDAETYLQLTALQQLKTAPQYANSAALDALIKETKARLPENEKAPKLSKVNAALMPLYLEKAIHEVESKISTNKIADLLDPKKAEELDNEMKRVATESKAKAEDKEFNTYTETLKKNLKGLTPEQQLIELRNEAKRKLPDNYKKFIASEIKAREEEIRRRKSGAPLSSKKGKVAPDAETTEQVKEKKAADAGIDANSLIDEFGGDSVKLEGILSQIDAISSNNSQQPESKIKALEKLGKQHPAAKFPALNQLIEQEIANHKADVVTNIRSTHEDVSVNDKYTYSGAEIVVDKIYDDGNGRTWIAMSATLNDQTKTVVQPIEFLKKAQKVTDSPVYPTTPVSTFDKLVPFIANKEGVTVAALFNTFTVKTEYEDLLKAFGNTVVKIDYNNELPKDAFIGYRYATEGQSSAILIRAESLEEFANLDQDTAIEVLAHEMLHGHLHLNGFTKKTAELLHIISKIKTPQELIATEAQIRMDMIRNQHPIELITYALTNKAIWDLISSEENKDAAAELVEFLNTDPLLAEIVNYRLSDGTKRGERETPATPEAVSAYTVTANAESLANQYFINLNEIEGTGVDGKITVNDVKKYIKENELKSFGELRDSMGLSSNVVAGAFQTNIYLPFLHGIVNGKVDADTYNAFVKRVFPDNPMTVNQEELEAAVRAIASPTNRPGPGLGTSSTLTAKMLPKKVIGIYTNTGVLIGILNNPDVTLKTISFVEELLEVTKASEIPEGKTTGQKQYAAWRLRELTLDKPTDRPLVEELRRLKNAYQSESNIRAALEAATSTDETATVNLTIVRKTSGNFAKQKDGKTVPLNEAFPDITELWFRPLNDPFPNLVSAKTGRKFSRNSVAATDYFNHDMNYNRGVPFILIPGANSFADEIDTFIPVPLKSANANATIANAAADIISRMVATARNLPWEDRFHDKKLQALAAELNAFFYVESVKKPAENYIHLDNDGIRFSYIENGVTKHVHILYSTKKSKQTILYNAKDKQRPERYDDDTSYKIDGGKDKLRQLSLTGKASDAKAFRSFIVNALQQKATHIDYTSMNKKGEFRDGLDYVAWMLKNGALHTDLAPLRDGNGEIMRDERGNMLPNITDKYTESGRNSNLIIAVDNSSFTEAPGVMFFGEKLPARTEKSSDVVGQEVPDNVAEQTAKKVKLAKKDVKALVANLLKNGTATLEYKGDPLELSVAIQTSLPAHVVDYKVEESGAVTLTLTDATMSQLKPSAAKGNEGTQGKLFREAKPKDETLQKMDIEAARAWWTKTFGGHVPFDVNVMGMLNYDGIKAWGVFENGMVKIANAAPIGTEYHEGFHAAFWLYNSVKEREAILNETAKRLNVDRLKNVSEEAKAEAVTKIKSFLNSLGAEIDTDSDIFTDDESLQSAFDFLGKVIYLRNASDLNSLVNHTVDFAYRLLGKASKTKISLLSNITEWTEYDRLYAKYKRIIRPSKDSEVLIKSMIVKDALREILLDNLFDANKEITEDLVNSRFKFNKYSNSFVRTLAYYARKIKIMFTNLLNVSTEEKLLETLNSLANVIKSGDGSTFYESALTNETNQTIDELLAKDKTASDINEIVTGFGGLLTGSLALRGQGPVYRTEEESLHDLDYTIPYDTLLEIVRSKEHVLGAGPAQLIIDYKKGINTTTPGLEMLIKNFKTTDAYKNLISSLSKFGKVSIKAEFINKSTRGPVITLQIGDYLVDLFLTTDPAQTSSALKTKDNLQNWRTIFQRKMELGRTKDIKDLINFKPDEAAKGVPATLTRNTKTVLDDTALEEVLAEEFMDYMLRGGETEQVLTKKGNFFAKLLAWIKGWFKSYKPTESRTEKLFRNIRDGKFAEKPSEALVEAAKGVTRLRAIDGLRGADEQEAVNVLARYIVDLSESYSISRVSNINEASALVRIHLLRERSGLTGPQLANLDAILRPDVYDELWAKSVKYVKRQFNLDLGAEIDMNNNGQLERNWDDTNMSDSQIDNVNIRVKKLIMTTPSGKTGSFLGLDTFLNFQKVYPYIQRSMLGAQNIEEMMGRLRIMGEFDPSMHSLADKLEAEPSLKATWFSNFAKQSPARHVVLVNPDGINVEIANKNNSHIALSNKWIESMQVNLESDYYTDEIKNDINKRIVQVDAALKAKQLNQAVSIAVPVLNHLGVDITEANLSKIINLPHLVKKFGTPSNIFTEVVIPIFNMNDLYVKKYKSGTDVDYINYVPFNRLAAVVSLYKYDLMESNSINVNGDNVQSVINPSFLSLFMDKFSALKSDNLLYVQTEEAKQELVDLLKQYGQDLSSDYSNWLWSDKDNMGMLLPVDGKTDINAITTKHLNMAFIERFSHSLLDGLKNTANKESGQYKNMPNLDWNLTQMSMFFAKGDGKSVMIPILVPSDSGNIFFIESPKYKGANQDGSVKKGTPLFNAIQNLAYQDLYRAIAARDLLFDYDAETGTLSVKEDLDYSKLQQNYYFQKRDANGKPILLKDGKPTGNVFNAFNIPQAKGIGYYNGVPIYDKVGTAEQHEIELALSNATSQYIREQTARAVFALEGYRTAINGIKEYRQEYGSNYFQFLTEFALNTKISYVEQMNFLVGNESEYKMDRDSDTIILDPNKRAKQVMSPGVSTAGVMKPSFTAATIKDIELKSKYFRDITNAVAEYLRKSNKDFRGKKVDVAKLESGETVTFNDLELATYRIVSGYLSTNTGDAQGYITIDRYVDIMRGLGRLTPKHLSIINKIRRNQSLSQAELKYILQPVKGFYYGRTFDPYLNRMVSHQIKYSTVPLVPQLVVGNQLENLYNWMNDNALDEVFYESAEKVGQTDIINIADENGNIKPDVLEQYSIKNGYEFHTYDNRNWRLQVDSVDHLVDDENKLGTQIAKIIIANLNRNAKYEYDGKSVNSQKLIEDYMDTMKYNIQESADNLLNEMGVKLVDGEYVISDIEKIHRVLMSEVEGRNLSDNYEDAIKLVENIGGKKTFNLPLFVNIMASKWESVLTSLFTNNVINQKQPGGSLVMFSSAFITNELAKPEMQAAETFELLTDVNQDSNTGIDWIKSKRDSKEFKLNPPIVKDGKVVIAEALMPRWSKALFNIDESGEMQPIPIDEIAEKAPELLEQIWYRIPYEKKGSSLVVKVVGFLPSTQGNILVLPQEAITMSGEDHDFDKRYGQYLQFYKDHEGNIRIYRWYDQPTDAAFEQWLQTRKAKALKRELLENPTEAIKKVETQIKRFTTKLDTVYATSDLIYSGQKTTTQELVGRFANLLNIPEEDQASLTLGNLNTIAKNRLNELNSMLNDVNEQIQSRYWEQVIFDSLVATQTEINTARRSVIATLESIKLSRAFYSELWTDASKEKKEKARELIDKYVSAKKDVVTQELREQFNAMSVWERNPLEARTNRITNIMKAILMNPTHYAEMMEPSGFSEAKKFMHEFQTMPGAKKVTGKSYTDMTTQNMLRSKNIDGIALKGMAADANSFMAVMQVAKMELAQDLSFYVKYDLNEYDEKDLIRKYGTNNVHIIQTVKKALTKEEQFGENADEAVVEKPEVRNRYAIVKHNRFAWNEDNTFTNPAGQYNIAAVAEILSLTLDIVKEGMIPNVNTYTLPMAVAMLSTGIPMREMGMMVNQPLLTDLTDLYFNNQSVLVNLNGNEISTVKSKYASKLLLVRRKLGEVKPTFAELKAAEEGRLFARGADVNRLLGYSIPTAHADVTNAISFSASELKAMIEYNNTELQSDLQSNDPAKLKKAKKFLTNQLLLAEKFLKYKEAGEAYSDMLNAASVDRRQVGPSLSAVLKLQDNINHATHYPTITRASSIVRQDKTVPEGLIGVYELRDIAGNAVKQFNEADIAKNGYVILEQGARVFAKVPNLDRKVAATLALYQHDVYSVMNAYKEFGYDLAYKTLSPLFIKYSPSFIRFANELHSQLGIRFNEDLFNKASNFAQAAILADLPFLDVDSNSVLGVDKPKVNLGKTDDGWISINEFNQLTAANKLRIVKEMLKDELDGQSHILNYLVPKVLRKDLNRTGFHSIEFLNSATEDTVTDYLIQSFDDMWNSSNEYVASLARDLVRYSYFTNGFTYKKNSFSKLIPTSVFASQEVGMNAHLERKMAESKNPNMFSTEMYNGQFTLLQKFIMNNYKNPDIVPKLDLTDPKVAKNWSINKVTGLMSINVNVHSTLPKALAKAQFILAPKLRTDALGNVKIVDQILYALAERKGDVLYFIPVPKLGNVSLTEYTDRSIIPSNNPVFDVDTYRSLIDSNGVGKNINNKEYAKAGDAADSYSILWRYATKHIGTTVTASQSSNLTPNVFKKGFGEFSNSDDYVQEDLVVVTAQSLYGIENKEEAAKKILNGMFTQAENGSVLLKDTYAKINSALAAGASIAFPSNVDSSKNAILDKNFHAGLAYLQKYLDAYVKRNQLRTRVSNGIVYYAKEDLKTIDNHHKC